jgi:hypothetical protein
MNSYLETAIAVVLVILVFSIITYIIQELIAANLEFRGKMLKRSIKQLLDSNVDSTLTDQLYEHSQIKKLQRDLTRIPSYISSNNFAIAILDLVARNAPAPTGNLFADFRAGLSAYAAQNPELNEWLDSLIKVSTSLDELKKNIETWYEDYMDRVTGWYKTKSTIVTRMIAVVVVLGFNINMVKITTTIQHNSELNARINATALDIVNNQQLYKPMFQENFNTRLKLIENSLASELQDTATNKEAQLKLIKAREDLAHNYTENRASEVDALLKKITDKDLPLGWSNVMKTDFQGEKLLWVMLGWILGVVAISMGAPFWFDLLVKLVNVRKAGIKPESSDT